MTENGAEGALCGKNDGRVAARETVTREERSRGRKLIK